MPTVSIIPNFSSFPLYLVATGLWTIQFLFLSGQEMLPNINAIAKQGRL
jgi:hypothetical protein